MSPKQIRLLVLMCLIPPPVFGQADVEPSVGVMNGLSRCFTLTLDSLKLNRNMTVGRFEIERQQSTAHCGCKSKVVEYTVDGIDDNYTSEGLIRAEFVDMKRDRLNLLIDPDTRRTHYRRYRIYIDCQPPR